MKKKCIFLFSGQSRVFPFCKDKSKRNVEVLNSFNKYVFTEDFKRLYDYQIFISTDDIHLSDSINYFGKEHIENIHLLNTGYYYKNINNEIKPVSEYLNAYKKKDFQGCRQYDNSIHQHYKILNCYNMFRNSKHFNSADIIIRMRLDVIIRNHFLPLIQKLEQDPQLQITMSWDFAAIGKPSIMECYFTGLENNYGNYKFNVKVPLKLPIMQDYHKKDKKRWTYAAERQLFEMLFEYCVINKVDINTAIQNIDFAVIMR